MKTKYLIVAIATTLASVNVFAQNKTTFGVRAGVNFQNLTGKSLNGEDLDNKITPGFNVGVNAEIPVGIDFYLQPGVLFTTKGAKLGGSDDKLNISYIEIPVNFLYKPSVGTGRLLLGFGPYAAFGVGGRYKPENGSDVDIEFRNSVPLDEASSVSLKRFDAGANFLFGYEMANNLSVQLNAGLGLLEINPKVEGMSDKGSLKNTGFGVSIGYRF